MPSRELDSPIARFLSRCLPGAIRKDLFEPAVRDLETQHVADRRSSGARPSSARITLRVLGLFVDCWRLAPGYALQRRRDARLAEPQPLGFRGRAQSLRNVTLVADDARSALGWLWLERLGQDLRYAFRSMRHNRSFTLLVVLSLALGIGANTAIFSFMESILLRSLPVHEPEALVVMKWRAREYTLATRGMSWSTGGSSFEEGKGTTSSIFPYPALRVFQDSGDIVASAFSYFAIERLSVTSRDASDSVKGHYVTGNYFHGMGVSPAAGRLIHQADDQPGAPPVVVLSEPYSRRRFGEAAAAIGQTIRINDKPFEIVGVAPVRFFGAEPGATPDVFMPIHARPIAEPGIRAEIFNDDHFYWVEIMARLKPGVQLVQAQAALAPRYRHFAESTAASEKERQDLPELTLLRGATGLDSLRREYAQPIYVLMTMVGLILLIACSNIANLLLTRAAARRREIAVRLSIGAGRWRVIRQLLTESVLLAAIGGALGVALAWWGIDVLTALLAGGRDNFTMHAALNWRVLGVTAALSVLTGLAFGLVPALQATRLEILPALKDVRSAQPASASRRLAVGPFLIAIQIALSVVLLVGAGLFGRTLAKLHAIEIGFNRENVLLFTVRPSTVGYRGPALYQVFEDLRERLRAVPGVLDMSLSSRPLPMGGGTMAQVTVDGASPIPEAEGRPRRPYAVLASVGPAFFRTMQIPLAGREFSASDTAGAPKVVIVNRLFAKMFALENPVGWSINIRNDRFEIVGVADDALAFTLKEERRPITYFSYLQAPSPPEMMTYELRSAGNPLDLAGPVRELVRKVDTRLAIHDLKTQAVHVDQAISREITLAKLGSGLAALALVIACVGLYGTVAFNVARRTNEIGIRMALGAPPGRIIGMVLGEVLALAVAGLVVGLGLSLLGSRYVKTLLYGIEPNDPATVTMAVLMLLGCGLIAAFPPARRAARIDPIKAVRQE
jgi:macrolide transport system ATP-binding/permease protein